MKKFKSGDIKPKNENVLVEVQRLEETVEGVYVGNGNGKDEDAMPIEFFIGKVVDFGDKAAGPKYCPELEKGKYVYFNQFSGCSIATEDSYSKVIRGYDIIAISNDMDMNKEEIRPTNDRILVEVLKAESITEGVYTGEAKDPREANVSLAKVLSCGVNATEYAKGTIVAFEPYCGNPIIRNTKEEIKTINSEDILFTL